MGAGGFSGGSLAVFTALAPAGAVAFAIAALFVLVRRDVPDQAVDRLSHMLIVPLGVAWAGFIASATHLGTPANALYAVSGLGRSPLSNEVVAALLFLLVAGVYWLYTFKMDYKRGLARLLAALSVVSCIAMVGFMAFAYSVPTVPSWDTWHTPVDLCLTSLLGGCALGASLLRTLLPETRRWRAVLRGMTLAVLVISAIMLVWHAAFLADVSNNVATAGDGVPFYGVLIAVHVALGAVGVGLQQKSARSAGWKAAVVDACGCALVLAAVLVARIPFYAAYLSVGF